MKPEAFRTMILRLPGTEERQHMGHPDFRVGGRIFASLLTIDHEFELDHAMVKLEPGVQSRLFREHPSVFAPAAGAWGRQGCTLIRLARAKAAIVKHAAELAWRRAAPASLARSLLALQSTRGAMHTKRAAPKGDSDVSFKQRPGQKRKKMSGGPRPKDDAPAPQNHPAPPHEPDSPDHNTGKAGRVHAPDKAHPGPGNPEVGRKGGTAPPRLGPRGRGG